jgi:RNA polymerase sigma-70 factor (ECF subfamily)
MSISATNPALATFDQLFSEVCDSNQPAEIRKDRFAALLRTAGGPFADCDRPMIESILSLAHVVTNKQLKRLGLPASSVNSVDVAEDALVALSDNCAQVSNVAKLRAWLWTVMSRRITLILREDRRRLATASIDLGQLEHEPTVETVDDKRPADASPKAQAVRLAMNELSPRLRDVVVLHVQHNLTHEEIGRVLAVDAGTVRVRWHRAKSALSARLSQHHAITG